MSKKYYKYGRNINSNAENARNENQWNKRKYYHAIEEIIEVTETENEESENIWKPEIM